MIKISRTNRILRIFSGILCIVFALGGAGLLLYNNINADSLQKIQKEVTSAPGQFKKVEPLLHNTEKLLEQQNFWILLVSISGFILSLGIMVFSLRRSISAYQRYIKRLERVPQPGRFLLEKLSFPENDEFGNLGYHLNLLLKYLKQFEMQRENMRFKERNRFKQLSADIDSPVICIDRSQNIVEQNHALRETFFLTGESYTRTLFGIFKTDEEMRNSLENSLTRLFNGKDPVAAFDEVPLTARNNRFLCDLRILPVDNASGETPELLVLFHDVKFLGPAGEE